MENEFQEYIANLRRFVEALPVTAIDALDTIAITATEKVSYRVIQTGINKDHNKFDPPYTEAYRRLKSGLVKPRKNPKTGKRPKARPDRSQGGHVNFFYTGRMWASIQPRGTKQADGGYRVEVRADDGEQVKVDANVARRGDFLALQEGEEKELSFDLDAILVLQLQHFHLL